MKRETHPAFAQFLLGATTMFCMSMGVFVLFALSALAPFIIDELGWSLTLFGTLMTLTSGVAMLLSISAGRFVDASWRPSTPGLILLAATTMGLASLSVGTAYGAMAIGAAFGGVAMSLSNPSTNKLVSAFGAPHSIGSLIGLKQSGVQVGMLVCGALLPPTAPSQDRGNRCSDWHACLESADVVYERPEGP